MNTATPSFHERLRAFFSRFSFILKEKYDFFRHHSRGIDHHTLHKSPLSESFRAELDTEKELVFDYFSSLFVTIAQVVRQLFSVLFRSIGQKIIGIYQNLARYRPFMATTYARGGLVQSQLRPPVVHWMRRKRARPLALPRPRLPSATHYFLHPPSQE